MKPIEIQKEEGEYKVDIFKKKFEDTGIYVGRKIDSNKKVILIKRPIKVSC